MAEQLTLLLNPRGVIGKKVKLLREGGITPVHLYGPGVDSLPLQCDTPSLLRVMSEAGTNTPINIQIEGESKDHLAFVRETQWHPVSGVLLHIDFVETALTALVTADVPLVLTGIAEGDRIAGGTLVQNLRVLHVEALPMDLPREVAVDAANLTDPDRVFRAGEISLPDNVTLLTNAEEPVARIEFFRDGSVAGDGEGPPVEVISARDAAPSGSDEA